jgi:hypothetical protein
MRDHLSNGDRRAVKRSDIARSAPADSKSRASRETLNSTIENGRDGACERSKSCDPRKETSAAVVRLSEANIDFRN